jgi:hypothetical protein
MNTALRTQNSPEGRKENSPGLQPWVRSSQSHALKVASDVSATDKINTLYSEQTSRSPLSGRSDCLPDPGLKPWAVICSPFGRESRPLSWSIENIHNIGL